MSTDKNNESIVNTAFAACGILVYFIAAVLLEVFAGTFGAVARVRNIAAVQHGFPVGAGIICFLILFMNKRIHTWADECVTEVRKVVWPSRKDTVAMTVVVCVMVLLAGLGFGVWDFFAAKLIKLFVG